MEADQIRQALCQRARLERRRLLDGVEVVVHVERVLCPVDVQCLQDGGAFRFEHQSAGVVHVAHRAQLSAREGVVSRHFLEDEQTACFLELCRRLILLDDAEGVQLVCAQQPAWNFQHLLQLCHVCALSRRSGEREELAVGAEFVQVPREVRARGCLEACRTVVALREVWAIRPGLGGCLVH